MSVCAAVVYPPLRQRVQALLIPVTLSPSIGWRLYSSVSSLCAAVSPVQTAGGCAASPVPQTALRLPQSLCWLIFLIRSMLLQRQVVCEASAEQHEHFIFTAVARRRPSPDCFGTSHQLHAILFAAAISVL
ncbi:hypothetical protein [Escherichia coli]|uniref:hypothetical protein n=1 Tax=Escherichia coli TaxID=562 RepID=UPI00388F90D1